MTLSRLRKRKSVNYWDDLVLPRERVKIEPAPPDQLYPLIVIDEDEERQLVKVHYEGYSSRYDEWRPKDDIVNLDAGEGDANDDVAPTSEVLESGPVSPFNLYQELLINIKTALAGGRKKTTHARVR